MDRERPHGIRGHDRRRRAEHHRTARGATTRLRAGVEVARAREAGDSNCCGGSARREQPPFFIVDDDASE
jgi:hypothetical protein